MENIWFKLNREIKCTVCGYVSKPEELIYIVKLLNKRKKHYLYKADLYKDGSFISFHRAKLGSSYGSIIEGEN